MTERVEVVAGGVAAAAGIDSRVAPIAPAGGETAEFALVASPEPSGGPAGDGAEVAGGAADSRGHDGAPGACGAGGAHGASAPAERAAGEASGEGVARPTLREDLTLLLTVLLGTPGEDLTVVVGARRGERPHARFARLTVPRDGWIASLFRGGDPAACGGEPATTLAAYVADASAALAEEKARTSPGRPAGGQSPGQGAAGGRRQQQASVPWRRRPADGAAPAGEAVAATGGTAALLARRKAGRPAAPAEGTPTRRSLFDLDDDLS